MEMDKHTLPFAYLLLFLAFFSCHIFVRPDFVPCTQTKNGKSYIIKKINNYRGRYKRPELFTDFRLSLLAQKRAEALAKSPNPSHLDSRGRGPLERIQASGLRRGFVGENFTFLFSKKGVLDQLLLTWAQARRERQNLLSKNYARIGIGLALRGRHCVAVALFTD